MNYISIHNRMYIPYIKIVFVSTGAVQGMKTIGTRSLCVLVLHESQNESHLLYHVAAHALGTSII